MYATSSCKSYEGVEMLTIMLSVLLFLFFLPAIVIYSLTTISLNSKIPYECIDESPLTEEEMIQYGIVYKGHTWVEEEWEDEEK